MLLARAVLAELDREVDLLGLEIIEAADSLPVDLVLADSRMKCLALMKRRQAIAADVAVVKAMLALR